MRLIDADDYRECLCEQLHMTMDRARLEISTDYEKGLYDAARLLNTQPTIELEPKRGRWIHVSEEMWKCDQCREISCCSPKFCPDCGARMEVDI